MVHLDSNCKCSIPLHRSSCTYNTLLQICGFDGLVSILGLTDLELRMSYKLKVWPVPKQRRPCHKSHPCLLAERACPLPSICTLQSQGKTEPCEKRAAFKSGRRVRFFASVYNAKTTDCSPSSGLIGLDKSPKWRDELHLWSSYQVTYHTALTDFNPGQFKTCMRKKAA